MSGIRRKSEIARGIKALLGSSNMVVAGKVASVDAGELTLAVDPTDSDMPTLEGVRIRPLLDSGTNGLYGVPEPGANVQVLMLDDEQGLLISCDAYEYIVIRSDEAGGLVKVEALTERLNAIENKVNDILAVLKTHIHPTPAGPSTPSTDFAAIASVATTDRADIENELVKHG